MDSVSHLYFKFISQGFNLPYSFWEDLWSPLTNLSVTVAQSTISNYTSVLQLYLGHYDHKCQRIVMERTIKPAAGTQVSLKLAGRQTTLLCDQTAETNFLKRCKPCDQGPETGLSKRHEVGPSQLRRKNILAITKRAIISVEGAEIIIKMVKDP